MTQTAPSLALPDERAVMVAGDWHCDGTAARMSIERAADCGVHTVLHVGDLGVGPWPREMKAFTALLDRYLAKAGSVLLVAPGNHENYDTIDAAPRDQDGLVVLGERVRALPRGHRWQQAGRRFAALGGAVSVDQERRIPGRSWWPQEKPTRRDLDALGDAPLDVLITHEVPAGVPVTSTMTGIPQRVLEDAQEVRALLAEAVDRTRPALVFSGHWHQHVVHAVPRRDGGETTVHVLDCEHAAWNCVVLDLDTLAVRSLAKAWHTRIVHDETWEAR